MGENKLKNPNSEQNQGDYWDFDAVLSRFWCFWAFSSIKAWFPPPGVQAPTAALALLICVSFAGCTIDGLMLRVKCGHQDLEQFECYPWVKFSRSKAGG